MALTGPATAFAVGRSAAWCRFVERASRVAPLGVTVLIRGETGSGKEIAAKLIVATGTSGRRPRSSPSTAQPSPRRSSRASSSGTREGSFSGATEARRGLFEEAHRGTLFLDEIGALPLAAQAKLLRVLEDARVRRVGENRVTDVDVRVIAATSLDIEAAIARREFREDLYFRLSALELVVPPLRERVEDIPLLVAHFLEKLEEQGGPSRNGSPGRRSRAAHRGTRSRATSGSSSTPSSRRPSSRTVPSFSPRTSRPSGPAPRCSPRKDDAKDGPDLRWRT